MTTKVTEQGIIIPKTLLGDMDEVEIRVERDFIVIVSTSAKDPILNLGQQPVTTDVNDASINHDAYLHSG